MFDTLFERILVEYKGDRTNSPEFMSWFKNSKVLDKHKKPMVVYHSTNNDFSTFDGNESAQGVFWFTDNIHSLNAGEAGATGGKAIMPVYLSIQKMAGWKEYEKYGIGELQRDGYDGIKLDDNYVVFNANQIKSTFNKGTFNPDNDDIRESI